MTLPCQNHFLLCGEGWNLRDEIELLAWKLARSKRKSSLFFPNKRESKRERSARNDQKPIDYKNNEELLFLKRGKFEVIFGDFQKKSWFQIDNAVDFLSNALDVNK